MRPAVLAVESDLHAGSTVAPCSPDGIELDDGGRYMPSDVQVWLWEKRCEFWNGRRSPPDTPAGFTESRNRTEPCAIAPGNPESTEGNAVRSPRHDDSCWYGRKQ
jgi:hypothetical protein